MNKKNAIYAIRGDFIDFESEPSADNKGAMRFVNDGLMIIENGKIIDLGDTKKILASLGENVVIHDYRGSWIMPGLIDTHIHLPQSSVIASYGAQLLDWLNKYTFPAETRMEDEVYCAQTADFFLKELWRNGTTTAVVFASVHPQSADALFSTAATVDMKIIAGKVLMDRNAPDYLCDTAQSGYDDSKLLIEKWHGKNRASYAVTPRFAPTSTEAQLESISTLLQEYSDLYVQTHVAENQKEVGWVAELFPWSRSYLDVYEKYGLLRNRAMLAHCLYLDDIDRQRIGEQGAAIAFCPTSNLFLGSGLFNLQAAKKQNIKVSLATDIGGGTSFSMLQTMSEAYKVLQLQGQSLTAQEAFYLSTLGAAKSLAIDNELGNFDIGKAADFIVINPKATEIMSHRMQFCESWDEKLFVLMMLGDDRVIQETYINGASVHKQAANN